MDKRYRIGTLRATAAAIAVLCMFSASASSQDEKAKTDATKSTLQKMYMSYLVDEGYKPEIDPDGDIRFKSEGRTCYITIDEKDTLYFRLLMPRIWTIDNEVERRKVLVAADQATFSCKVAKVYTLKDSVSVSVELFVAKPEDFKGIFKRSLAALGYGYSQFVAKMRE
jgi:hypothetical protein